MMVMCAVILGRDLVPSICAVGVVVVMEEYVGIFVGV